MQVDFLEIMNNSRIPKENFDKFFDPKEPEYYTDPGTLKNHRIPFHLIPRTLFKTFIAYSTMFVAWPYGLCYQLGVVKILCFVMPISSILTDILSKTQIYIYTWIFSSVVQTLFLSSKCFFSISSWKKRLFEEKFGHFLSSY